MYHNLLIHSSGFLNNIFILKIIFNICLFGCARSQLWHAVSLNFVVACGTSNCSIFSSLVAQLVKNLPAGDPGSILRSGRSSGKGIGFWVSLMAQMVKNLPAMWES